MFKFNFSNEEDTENKTVEEKVWLQSKEIFYGVTIKESVVNYILENCEINLIETPSYEIKHFSSNDILNALKTSDTRSDDLPKNKSLPILNAEKNHSDLNTAVYEGGLKIWECTFDLLNYIADQKLCFQGKAILDLGCGAGLIGIFGIINGGDKCMFQDYNEDVLKYITIPNVNVNVKSHAESILSNIRFFSGDWQYFSNMLHLKESYSYIFTSETIYNTENYAKLHDVFVKLLQKDGQVYLAAKSYYFGVGGGVALFQDFLAKQKVFKYETTWKCSEGVSREILKITFL